jgi:hypothetical protein
MILISINQSRTSSSLSGMIALEIEGIVAKGSAGVKPAFDRDVNWLMVMTEALGPSTMVISFREQ